MRSQSLGKYGAAVALALATMVAGGNQSHAADTVVDDFATVQYATNPSGGFGVWHAAHSSAFSSATTGSLGDSLALRYNDAGFTNGIYTIYQGVVPETGNYTLEAIVDIIENADGLNGVRALQVGVAVGANANHRAGTALPALTIVGNYSGTLTTGDDNANPIQTITTPEFAATAGDNILIAIATDVTSGGWNQNSGTWGTSHVLVDKITLKGSTPPPPPPPTTAVTLKDFSGGVSFVSHPNPGTFDVWYNAAHNGFTSTLAGTLNGPSLRMNDGGFANGAYTILQGAIPADGTYTLEALIDIVEDAATPNGVRGFQIGVAVGANAVHRGVGTTLLPQLTTYGTYIGLTPNNDNANPPQTVVTNQFTANAGDNILIAIGTDVQSGLWNGNSAAWATSHVLVDDIVLRSIHVEPPPFELILDNDNGPSVYASNNFSTSGAVGFNGGTYQFATSGGNAYASWTGIIPEDGYYEVSAIYVAGTNRAAVAKYEITTSEGIETGTIDQRTNSLTWVHLGDFNLAAGPATITLDVAGSQPVGSPTVVIADAVRIRELPGPPPIDEPEMRIANLLVYDGLNDVGKIQNYINDIARKRYNAVAVHTRYRGDATYFPNKYDSTFPNIEPRSPLVGSVDVLEEVVTRGHAAGLKVFAYVNTMLVTEGQDTDPRPEHVLNRFPEWATWERNGGNPQPHTTATEIDGIWLDPALPEVQIYNAQIIGDIVMNYDVDGVVIDRQRYPDTRFNRLVADYGYHPEAVARFNAETGKTGIPDPFDTDWWDFRREANTRAMAHIYSTVTSIDPDCLVLAYPIGRFNDAINFNYQDWPNWMNKKVADIVLPQMYTASNADFSARASEHKNAYSGERFLGISLDVFRPGNDLVGQVNIARILGYQGTALFAHADMGPLGYFDVLPTAWPGTAAWPETPWKAAPVQCDGYDIIGIDGDTILVGTACDEKIVGSATTDEIYGAAGNDLLVVGKIGNNIIDGGSGVNTVDYSSTTQSVVIDLISGSANLVDDVAVTDSIANIQHAVGNDAGFNVLVGGDGANRLTTGSGDHDSINGGAGNDLIDGGAGDKDVSVYVNKRDEYHVGVNSKGQLVVVAKSGNEGTDTLLNIERLRFHNGIVHVSKIGNLVHISELYPEYVEEE